MSAKKKPGFEEIMAELESITTRLEKDDLSLDKALSYFEDGVKLMRQCEEQLKSAEGRLLELTKSADGSIIENDMETTNELSENGEDLE
jgi:exodeoxyribonuclease VII small subunit